MITRFNYEPSKSRDSSHDDELIEYTYKKKIRVLSEQKDGSVDKYVEENYFDEKKSSWSEIIESYNLGSVQDQVMDHLTKGTPLVTAHTLPAADYTRLERGARIKKEMSDKGITLDMIIEALTSKVEEKQKPVEEGV